MEELKKQLTKDEIPFKEFKTGTKKKQKALDLFLRALPANIINEIKATAKLEYVPVSGIKNFNEKILRCKRLVFQANGTFMWDISQFKSTDFIVIAADEITLNAPATINEIASLVLYPLYKGQPYNNDAPMGETGYDGMDGTSPPNGTGQAGGHGQVGGIGIIGRTYNYPQLFVFFDTIKINTANPTIRTGLQIFAEGVNGGKGGNGGIGGDGGNGARGSDGSFGGFPPHCTGGAGRGGNAGYPAQGGKGGKAGIGGNGGTITFVCNPIYQSTFNDVSFFLNKGKAGAKGVAGQDGKPGQPGGGGSIAFGCTGGGGNGDGANGNIILNPNKGIGEGNVDGIDGTVLFVDRDNSDI